MPTPRRCWVFSDLFGLRVLLVRLVGDYGVTNAPATAWISVGSLWMMGGLCIEAGKASQ